MPDDNQNILRMRDMEPFLHRVLLATSAVITLGMIFLVVANLNVGTTRWMSVGPAVIALLSASAFVVGWTGRRRTGARILVYGGSFLISVSMVFFPAFPDVRPHALLTFVILGAILVSPRSAAVVCTLGLASYVIGMGRFYLGGSLLSAELPYVVALAIQMIVITLLLFFYSRRFGQTVSALKSKLVHDETLFARLPSASSSLSAAADQLAATLDQHGEGAQRQSAAVSETQQTLRSVSKASEEIVSSAGNTATNAETTLQNSEDVASHVIGLAEHIQGIAVVLGTVKDIANKTDLLALNAALEGARAGTAGRGFQLVAGQMQRLAEQVAESVRQIEELTADIENENAATQHSMKEMMSLARATSKDSRHIHSIVGKQQTNVAQIIQAIDDISGITSQVADGSAQASESTQELRELAENLTGLVDEFSRDLVPTPTPN